MSNPDPYEAASALLVELQRQLRAEAEEWRTKQEDPHNLNYCVSIACAVQAEAIERTLKMAVAWRGHSLPFEPTLATPAVDTATNQTNR